MKIGGVTGWLRAAPIAQARDLPVMSHVFPEVSAHLLCITPTAHRLEYLDKAGPILKRSLKVEDGHALVPDGSGIGLEWNEAAIETVLLR